MFLKAYIIRKRERDFYFFNLTNKVLSNTTVIELIGISIAATSGVKFPEIAKLSPTILYEIENNKHTFKTVFEKFEILNK